MKKSNACPYCLTRVDDVDDVVVSNALVARPTTELMQAAFEGKFPTLILAIDNHKGIRGTARAYMVRTIKKSPLFASAMLVGVVAAVLSDDTGDVDSDNDDAEAMLEQAFEASYFSVIRDKIIHLIK